MDLMNIVWLAAVIVPALIEAMTSQMISIWFSAAALVSLISQLLGAPLWLQITLFIVCAAALLIFTRPIAKRLMNRPITRTNADRVIDMTGHVTEDIDNDAPSGLVKVAGQLWSARSASGSVICKDSKVVVRSIEGVKLIVDEALEIQTKSKEVAQCQQ